MICKIQVVIICDDGREETRELACAAPCFSVGTGRVQWRTDSWGLAGGSRCNLSIKLLWL